MCQALEELMEDRIMERINSSVNASRIADREEIAKRMLRRNHSVSEIAEITDVREARISELAGEIGLAPVSSDI